MGGGWGRRREGALSKGPNVVSEFFLFCFVFFIHTCIYGILFWLLRATIAGIGTVEPSNSLHTAARFCSERQSDPAQDATVMLL